jgi:two-component system sensor histidine kinase VanS
MGWQSSPSSTAILGWRPRLTVRLRLTLSYAAFLVISAAAVSALIYLVMRYVPDYPLTSAQEPGLPVASRGEILDTLLTVCGVAIALLAVIGLGGGWILAGRMLRPLQQINHAARLAATGSLDHRLGLSGRNDEFKELGDTFDDMLDRLQRSFHEHQRFAANASHELRTPQTITKMMLEVAMSDPSNQDYGELTRRLHETNERGIAIVRTLLTLADLDSQPVPVQRVELASAASAAVEDLILEADSRGVRVRTDLDPCEVTGNPLLIHQLVTNLMQNAVRHNTATGGSVSIRTSADPLNAGMAQLVISNTGEVIAKDSVSRMIEPFVRGRTRLAGAGGRREGHGLGLALVSRIVAAHQGTLKLSAQPTGGLTVTVGLPSH